MPDFFWIVMIAWGGMFLVYNVVKMICRTIADGIRGRSGAGWDKDGNVAVPPMFDRMLDKSMTARDEKYHALEERVRVLEQIVTDGHKKRSLADEIDSLRDKA